MISPALHRACLGKNRYTTEDFASKLAKRIHDERGTDLRPYYCGMCQGWHLTKQPKKATA
jgi:hypothetical protein